MAERVNLVVLFGGQSAEHDVSCVTAAHVLRAVDPEAYRVTAIGIARDGSWCVAEAAMAALAHGPEALPSRLAVEGPRTSAAPVMTAAGSNGGPVVVLPLLHGPLGEDGTVQGLLELAGVPYVGSGVLSSAVAMDKAMAKLVLAQHGFTQADWVSLREDQIGPETPQEIVARLGLPVFVKPANMGSSVGVQKAKSVDELRDAIAGALQYDEWIVVEEAIVGREIEVAVLGNRNPRASVPGEIVPGHEFYDYADKYLEDGSQLLIPAPLTAEQTTEVQRLAVEAFEALRCDGLARVDFFYDTERNRWVINEVNTIPGFTPISMYPKMWQASGVGYGELIDELIRLAVVRHGSKRRNTER